MSDFINFLIILIGLIFVHAKVEENGKKLDKIAAKLGIEEEE